MSTTHSRRYARVVGFAALALVLAIVALFSPLGSTARRDIEARLYGSVGADVVMLDDMVHEARRNGHEVVDITNSNRTFVLTLDDGSVITAPAQSGRGNVIYVTTSKGHCIEVIGGPEPWRYEHGARCFPERTPEGP